VDFREACNQHDAAYSGAKVTDMPLNGGKVIDYFDWTKKRIDDKFYDDMVKICDDKIPATATVARANCKASGGFHLVSGAASRYRIVRASGWSFFKARPNLAGVWEVRRGSGAPAWTITQDDRSVTATWTGGADDPEARSEFRGTIISRDQDSTIEGFEMCLKTGAQPAGRCWPEDIAVLQPLPMKLGWDPTKPRELRILASAGGEIILERR
jgi:hypothetical protein